MKPLELNKRPCRLGPTINSRREKHGTENVPALDLTLNALLLTKAELDKLVGAGFWNSRYESRTGGQPPVPAWPKMKGEKYGEKLECDVLLSFMSENEQPIAITEAKVGKLEFEYQIGGLTACYFTVSTSQDNVDLNKLRDHMDGEVSAQIVLREPKPEKAKAASADNEPELGLVHHGGEDAGEEGDGAGSSPQVGVGIDDIGPETRAAIDKKGGSKKSNVVPIKGKPKPKGGGKAKH